MTDWHHLSLRASSQALELLTGEENRQLSRLMISQCRRTVDIISRDLDPLIYDSDELSAMLKDMVIRNRRARIRILVQKSDGLISSGHRLIDITRRLPSYFEIMKPGPEHKNFNEAFLVCDEAGFIHRELADRYQARADFNDRMQSALLLRQFEEIWEKAQPDPNLRRLAI